MKPKIAKVGVEGSNPFARSNFPRNLRPSLGGVSALAACWRALTRTAIKKQNGPSRGRSPRSRRRCYQGQDG